MNGLIVDLFAGGGGASIGIEAALRRKIDIAINHDEIALEVHQANHPETLHLVADIWEVRPKLAVKGRAVDLLWASPDCTHFSVAKGDVPRSGKIRSLAWAVVRWARETRPNCIALENVPEFQKWGPLAANSKPDKAKQGESFKRFVRQLEKLGYRVEFRVLDSSLFGAPTKRRRLFLFARRDGQPIAWPMPTHGAGLKPLRTAAEIIDWSIACPSIFERKKPLAEKTQIRIAAGIRRFVLDNPTPFIVRYNGNPNDSRFRGQRPDAPLTTVDTSNRFAIVAPTMVQTGYGERPGQRPRYLDLHAPIGTFVNGQKHGLVAAFLAKHFGGVVGHELTRPVGAVTAKDHHSLVTVGLDSAKPGRVWDVRAFLTKFYKTATGQKLDDPLHTITTKHRLGLVTVEGVDFQIVDIGMRMLEPHELLRAQFGRFAATYDLSAAPTKSAKVRLIGNSVCPEVAEALIAANMPRGLRAAA